MVNPISSLLASNAWRNHVLPAEITGAVQAQSALRAIEKRWPFETVDDDHSPLFILSAGWGSGSTLLQRLLISGGECLLWGEPFDHAAPIHRLMQTLYPIAPNWPREEYFIGSERTDDLSNKWIANLTPQFAHLREAHRNFLLTWLRVPAAERGYQRWGLKEVRLTIDHARYLKWLFPRAKFLLIYRDVLDSYRSCKNVNWLSIWPNYPVRRVSLFAHHWRFLLEGFLADASSVGALLVKFEDLTSGKLDLATISAYAQAGALDRSVLDVKVGSRRDKHGVNPLERFVLTSVGGDLRRRLGYS